MLKLKQNLDLRRPVYKVIMWGSVISAFGFVITSGLVSINKWSYAHEIVTPIEINVKTRSIIRDRKPIEVLSPVVEQVLDDPITSKLSPIEQKIFDVFGIMEFKTARAVAKCESGFNPEAIHYNTNATYDAGLYQINSIHWNTDYCPFGLKDLLDADNNLKCAKAIYQRHQDTFKAWSAFGNGCFSANL